MSYVTCKNLWLSFAHVKPRTLRAEEKYSTGLLYDAASDTFIALHNAIIMSVDDHVGISDVVSRMVKDGDGADT